MDKIPTTQSYLMLGDAYMHILEVRILLISLLNKLLFETTL
jgi:hypothetical protein